jgi:ubiquinone/menaquinone biosynthesis C-methylase UbiE
MPKKVKEYWKIEDWIKKLKQQAEESMEYRHTLYDKVELKNKKNILDVGCGTGAVTLDIAQYTEGQVTGIDIDSEKLEEARKVLSSIPNIKLMEADVLNLPFEDEIFDLVLFNVVLIYIKDQQKALNEMARVTKKGGHVMATLEPDYASYITYPEDVIGDIVIKQMERLGADVKTGRKLKHLFGSAGLTTEMGIETAGDLIISKNDELILENFHKSSWVIEKMLNGFDWPDNKIKEYLDDLEKRCKAGTHFAFMPSFYAIGNKD